MLKLVFGEAQLLHIYRNNMERAAEMASEAERRLTIASLNQCSFPNFFLKQKLFYGTIIFSESIGIPSI